MPKAKKKEASQEPAHPNDPVKIRYNGNVSASSGPEEETIIVRRNNAPFQLVKGETAKVNLLRWEAEAIQRTVRNWAVKPDVQILELTVAE